MGGDRRSGLVGPRRPPGGGLALPGSQRRPACCCQVLFLWLPPFTRMKVTLAGYPGAAKTAEAIHMLSAADYCVCGVLIVL